jgi:exodeoxyribonuclease VII large subunit
VAAPAHRLALEANKVEGMRKRLVALNPFEVLARGYAVVTRQSDGSLIRSVGQAKENEVIEVRVSDGQFDASIVNRK